MPDVLVFDTSAILNFGHRGSLETLLAKLGCERRLCVTAEALGEITDPNRKEYYRDLMRAHFEVVTCPAIHRVSRGLAGELAGLGLGEAATLVYCEATENSVAVIDEKAGRAAGLKAGIRLTGTLGLLDDCREHGWTTPDQCLAAVTRIRGNGGRFLSPREAQSWKLYLRQYHSGVGGSGGRSETAF